MTDKVDTRKLRNGQVRLRFRLAQGAVDTVNDALNAAWEQTHWRSDGALLDGIAMSFLAGPPPSRSLGSPAVGSERFLVRFYPDQYETVRLALDRARSRAPTDAEALVMIATAFLAYSTGTNSKLCTHVHNMSLSSSCGIGDAGSPAFKQHQGNS